MYEKSESSRETTQVSIHR